MKKNKSGNLKVILSALLICTVTVCGQSVQAVGDDDLQAVPLDTEPIPDGLSAETTTENFMTEMTSENTDVPTDTVPDNLEPAPVVETPADPYTKKTDRRKKAKISE